MENRNTTHEELTILGYGWTMLYTAITDAQDNINTSLCIIMPDSYIILWNTSFKPYWIFIVTNRKPWFLFASNVHYM